MKDVVKKVTAFILFDSSVDYKLIDSQFLVTHSRYKERLPHWPLTASRKKLILAFWRKEVFPPFFGVTDSVNLCAGAVSKNLVKFRCPAFLFSLGNFLHVERPVLLADFLR